jgi:hypothetical protein
MFLIIKNDEKYILNINLEVILRILILSLHNPIMLINDVLYVVNYAILYHFIGII